MRIIQRYNVESKVANKMIFIHEAPYVHLASKALICVRIRGSESTI